MGTFVVYADETNESHTIVVYRDYADPKKVFYYLKPYDTTNPHLVDIAGKGPEPNNFLGHTMDEALAKMQEWGHVNMKNSKHLAAPVYSMMALRSVEDL